MMANKLFKKGLLLLASTMVMGLASCGEVDAELPKDIQEQKLVQIDANLPGNEIQKIYESIVTSGDSNSERILNTLLFNYGESYFGAFYGEGGLLEVYEDNSKAEAFAQAHAAFSDGDEVVDFASMVVKSLQKSFWDVRNNSSYAERGVFYERLFFRAEVKNLFTFEEPAQFKEKLLLGTEDYRDVDLYFSDFLNTYRPYIERNLIPNVYRKALIKDYLIKNQYGTLGRSYARKAAFIALPDLSTYPSATQNLVRSFCKICIEGENIADEFRDLSFLDRLYSGTVKQEGDEWDLAVQVYNDAGWTPGTYADVPETDIKENLVYTETTMGGIVKDFNELETDRNKSGSSTDFTSSGSYVKEIGLQIKERDTLKGNKVNQGWYTSSSMSGLLSDIKDRLFKMSVAAQVDDPARIDGYRGGLSGDDFGWYINGSFYMIPAKFERTEKYPYAIYDKSSSTWYICRVDQAVRTSKLNTENEENYDNDEVGLGFGEDGSMTLNQVNWEVAELLADTDSYKNACNQAIVKELAMKYHDDTVYKYFEKTFPDLFE